MVDSGLSTNTVRRSFFNYLIPSLIGMTLMSVNIVIDGIFVGNGISSLALASVNIAVPVYSIILSLALLIGIGGGALYSMALGAGEIDRAQRVFSTSMMLVTCITIIISVISYINVEKIILFFGANAETLPYAMDYMKVLLFFALFIAIETSLSIFVRNDGNPKLAMTGLIVTAVINIALNYWMIFILKWEVFGAAIATVIATIIGLLVLLTHFLRKKSYLKLVRFKLDIRDITQINSIGFPSFLSEVGIGIFIIGYNIAISYYGGTEGLAAFSVINYLHTFVFLTFIGIGSSIQPMISYYYGAKKFDMIKDTVRIAEKAALVLGGLFILISLIGADFLVSIFGVSSDEITRLATNGIRLFFLGYLFMGINFIYMTYYQSIGYVRPSIGITLFRGFILLLSMLYFLPKWLGVTGVWLALPVSEAIVAVFLIMYARSGIMNKELKTDRI